MEKLRRRLTLNERIVIETLLNENRTKSYIANQLNRNRSTITREVNNWVWVYKFERIDRPHDYR